MKLSIKRCGMAVFSISLMACTIGNGRICGPQTPSAYCDKEAYEKLAHPKAYGEHFKKPDMTKESWRQDWVACEGRSNGQYSGNVPPGSSDAVSSALWKQANKKLNTCMQSKGYEFRREP